MERVGREKGEGRRIGRGEEEKRRGRGEGGQQGEIEEDQGGRKEEAMREPRTA